MEIQFLDEWERYKLPQYLAILFKEREMVYHNYNNFKTEVGRITCFELDEIWKFECDIFLKHGVIDQPYSFEEMQENTEILINICNKSYKETKQPQYLDIVLALSHVRNVIKKIKDLKITEFHTHLVNEYYTVLHLLNSKPFRYHIPK